MPQVALEPIPDEATLQIGPAQISGMVRRHIHEVRNHANATGMELTLLLETVRDPEALESLRRMRSQFTQLESTLRGLTAKLVVPQPVALRAAELLDLWKGQLAPLVDAKRTIEWLEPQQSGAIWVDPAAIVWVLKELVMQSWHRSTAFTVKGLVKVAEGSLFAAVRQAPGTKMPPGMEDLEHIVRRNGGTWETTLAPSTEERIIALRFPLQGA